METETFIAGLPLSTAVPALSTAEPAAPATPAALRAELADAIRLRNEVDVKACAAAEIASRAESAKLDATMTVEQLKAGLDAAQRDATERHAEACTTAFRTGEALPPAPALAGSKLGGSDGGAGPAERPAAVGL